MKSFLPAPTALSRQKVRKDFIPPPAARQELISFFGGYHSRPLAARKKKEDELTNCLATPPAQRLRPSGRGQRRVFPALQARKEGKRLSLIHQPLAGSFHHPPPARKGRVGAVGEGWGGIVFLLTSFHLWFVVAGQKRRRNEPATKGESEKEIPPNRREQPSNIFVDGWSAGACRDV